VEYRSEYFVPIHLGGIIFKNSGGKPLDTHKELHPWISLVVVPWTRPAYLRLQRQSAGAAPITQPKPISLLWATLT
jgi:hypothetical protein